MAITHKITWSLSSNGQSAMSGSQVESGATEQVVDVTVPASTTNMLVPMSFARSAVQSLFVASDKALTLETNSGTSPANTFTMVAGCPLQWDTSAGYFALSAIFSADVTAFYLTNAGTAAARFQARVLTS